MKKYKTVSVLMGGPSAEREVSLRSGAAISRGLRQAGYDVREVDIMGHAIDLPPETEAVFIALHGEFGEDGTVQAELRRRGIPYTGSCPESSWLAFNKIGSKRVLDQEGIPTPPWEILCAGEARTLPLPVAVKPARQGSSIGVHLVFNEQDWADALRDAAQYDAETLVEAFIPGHELTVGIVVDQVLPIIEIRAPDGFYNYDAKYSKGLTEYLVPAPIPEDVARRCSDLGWRTFKALGCRGMGRVDFRMTPEGELYVLELNSIPGFTETSLMPKAAAAAGISFPELCDRILQCADV